MRDNQNAATTSISYWTFNYMPKWEAVSMEVKELSTAFAKSAGTRVIALNLWGRSIKLRGREKQIPLPYALPAIFLVRRIAAQAQINHVFASPGERILTPRLARLDNTILTIAKDSPRLDVLEKNVNVLRDLRYIVVESPRHKDLLLQLGIKKDRLKLIYPGVELSPYRPPDSRFRILFATSPLAKYDLLARGVHLMVRVAELLPEVEFRLIWRRNPAELRKLLTANKASNISVLSGYVEDMGAEYDASHATILPALTEHSLKPAPHSALLSLAHGKPVLVSRPTSLSSVVEMAKCGVVFEPSVDGLCEAIRELRANYHVYQERAQPAATECFSRAQFLARYATLYNSLLAKRVAVTVRKGVAASAMSHTSVYAGKNVRG